MKSLWCFTLLITFPLVVFSQQSDRIDSLRLVASVSADTTRFQALIDLSFAFTAVNMDSALFYSRKAGSLQKSFAHPKYKAAVFNSRAIIYYYKADYDSALLFFQKALFVNESIGRCYGAAINHGQLGSSYHMLNQTDSAIFHQQSAMELYKDMQDTAMYAIALTNLGSSLYTDGQYKEGLDFYLKALPLHRSQGDEVSEIKTLRNIGRVHQSMGLEDEAIGLYKEALEKAIKTGDFRMQGYLQTGLGELYIEIAEMDLAKNCYQNALGLFESIGKEPGGLTYLNLGKIALLDKKTIEAESFFLKSYESYTGKDDLQGILTSSLILAEFYCDMNLSGSQKFLKVAEEILERARFGKLTIDCYERISKVHQSLGNFRAALDYFRMYKAVSDSILSTELRTRIASLQTEKKLFQKEQKIQELALSNQLVQTRKNIYFALLIGIFVLSGLIVWFLLYRKKKNEQITKQKEKLAQERIDRLKVDLHHYT
ncbi:MAG: tetratricopeptide repeat protein, partial [Cyclobacteriaceae bacterium]